MSLPARFCLALCLAAALMLAPASTSAQGARPQQFQPGFRTIGIWNPATHVRLDVAVWYPTARAPRDMRIDGWSILVSRNAKEVPGQYPIILISHDAGSSRLAAHDMAANLARQGFLVIAPTHPGDNTDDTAGLYRAELFQDRPRHLLLALEAVLASPELAPLADESRIGLLGIGSGAATVLQLAGATPDLSALSSYCVPQRVGDPLCTDWARTHHAAMEKEYAAIVTAQGPGAFTPGLGFFAPPEEAAKTAADGEAALHGDEDEETQMTSPIPAPVRTLPAPAIARRPVSNRSIKAVGLMTPGWTGLLSEASLRAISVPIGIIDAADDALYSPAGNARALASILPRRPSSRTLEHTGHYALQGLCPAVSADHFAVMCSGRNERDREAAAQRDAFFVRFFQKELGSPLPPLPAPPEQPKRQPTRTVRASANATVHAPVAGNVTIKQTNGTKTGNGTTRSGERPSARRTGARR